MTFNCFWMVVGCCFVVVNDVLGGLSLVMRVEFFSCMVLVMVDCSVYRFLGVCLYLKWLVGCWLWQQASLPMLG